MIRIISYNLRHSRAGAELADLVAAEPDLDALCLQEVYRAGVPEQIGHLRLAHRTGRNLLDLAVYVDPGRFEVEEVGSFALQRSLHDVVFDRTPERLVGAQLRKRETGSRLVVASFHAAPLSARYSLRRKQIAAAHAGMRSLSPDTPAVMVGDFNYPWFIRGLERHLTTSGYTLQRTTEPTYLRYKFFSGYFDFVTSTGFEIEHVDVLPAGASDHRAISLDAELAA